LKKHAWEYGWLMSYPDLPFETICFHYEPWHYRYVGRELAQEIHDSGLTIREYLWANFTQLDSTLQPVSAATAEPSIAPSPIASPSASAPALPSAVPTSGVDASPVPTSPAGALFGIDPAVVITIGLLVLASIGLVVSVRFARRPRRG
jgi:D-alanyl-D-alanine carboxypeptidase